MEADEARYFYDELGRLVGVVDGSGDVAVYTYDEVGNLLEIERFTPGTTGIGIFLLAPNRALIGTDVKIGGFGFSTTSADNQVDFNGTGATVVSATATELVVTVPTGATSGPVTVTNSNGTATSPQPFTVLVPPIISGIEPERFARGATAQAVIEGFNLADATAVTFAQAGITAGLLSGATEAELPVNISVSSTVPTGTYTFSVTTPAGIAESGSVTITVTTGTPTFGLGEAYVFKPFPDQAPPSGPSFGVTPPTSVEMP